MGIDRKKIEDVCVCKGGGGVRGGKGGKGESGLTLG